MPTGCYRDQQSKRRGDGIFFNQKKVTSDVDKVSHDTFTHTPSQQT